MRKIMYFLLVNVFLTTSCTKKDDGLSKELYNKILIYQNKNRILYKNEPKNSPNNVYNYVYKVNFELLHNDTIVTIILEPQGIKTMKNAFGVYSDKEIFPTIIFDDDRLGANFINEYRKNKIKSFYNDKPSIVDTYYPMYFYKVKHKELVLIQKN